MRLTDYLNQIAQKQAKPKPAPKPPAQQLADANQQAAKARQQAIPKAAQAQKKAIQARKAAEPVEAQASYTFEQAVGTAGRLGVPKGLQDLFRSHLFMQASDYQPLLAPKRDLMPSELEEIARYVRENPDEARKDLEAYRAMRKAPGRRVTPQSPGPEGRVTRIPATREETDAAIAWDRYQDETAFGRMRREVDQASQAIAGAARPVGEALGYISPLAQAAKAALTPSGNQDQVGPFIAALLGETAVLPARMLNDAGLAVSPDPRIPGDVRGVSALTTALELTPFGLAGDVASIARRTGTRAIASPEAMQGAARMAAQAPPAAAVAQSAPVAPLPLLRPAQAPPLPATTPPPLVVQGVPEAREIARRLKARPRPAPTPEELPQFDMAAFSSRLASEESAAGFEPGIIDLARLAPEEPAPARAAGPVSTPARGAEPEPAPAPKAEPADPFDDPDAGKPVPEPPEARAASSRPRDAEQAQAPAVQDPANMVSKSGRKLSPYPDKAIKRTTARRVLREKEEWLIREALAEAEADGNELAAGHFRGELPIPKDGLPQASLDGANDYLFGAVRVRFERPEPSVPGKAARKVSPVKAPGPGKTVSERASKRLALQEPKPDAREAEARRQPAAASKVGTAQDLPSKDYTSFTQAEIEEVAGRARAEAEQYARSISADDVFEAANEYERQVFPNVAGYIDALMDLPDVKSHLMLVMSKVDAGEPVPGNVVDDLVSKLRRDIDAEKKGKDGAGMNAIRPTLDLWESMIRKLEDARGERRAAVNPEGAARTGAEVNTDQAQRFLDARNERKREKERKREAERRASFAKRISEEPKPSWQKGINKHRLHLTEDSKYWSDSEVLMRIPDNAKLFKAMQPNQGPLPDTVRERVWSNAEDRVRNGHTLKFVGRGIHWADLYTVGLEDIGMDRHKIALVERFHGPVTLKGSEPPMPVMAFNAQGEPVAVIAAKRFTKDDARMVRELNSSALPVETSADAISAIQAKKAEMRAKAARAPKPRGGKKSGYLRLPSDDDIRDVQELVGLYYKAGTLKVKETIDELVELLGEVYRKHIEEVVITEFGRLKAAAKSPAPVEVVERPEEVLDLTNRRPRDFSGADMFRSPLSVESDPYRITGSYEAIGGQKGLRVSRAFRAASERMSDQRQASLRGLDQVRGSIESLVKSKAPILGKVPRNQDEAYSAFIDIVERDLSDPVRVAVAAEPGPLGDALRAHDKMTGDMRNYIIESRRAAGIETPDDWGITEQGYFRHVFLGQFELQKWDGSGWTQVRGDDGRKLWGTYAEAQKVAAEAIKADPSAKIRAISRARNFPESPVRVSSGRYYQLLKRLGDRINGGVVISAHDVRADLMGIIGKNQSRRKWGGFLQERKGAEGYSRDYIDVMRMHAFQAPRVMELTRLNYDVAPLIESIRKGQPNLADAMQAHLEFLWGTPTKSERMIAEAIRSIPGLESAIPMPEYAGRSLANMLTGIHYQFLRFSPKSAAINILQPWQSLWPLARTDEFVRAYASAINPKRWKELQDAGVLDAGLKVEKGYIKGVQGALNRIPDPFQAASQLNRAVGYEYGLMQARKQGLSGKSADKLARSWAERTEFDNSAYNKAPALRGQVGRKIAFQFQGFRQKTMEAIVQALLNKDATRLERISAAAKGLAAAGALGGAKTIGAFVPGAAVGVTAAAGLLYMKLKENGLSDNDATEWTNAVLMGAPSLLGLDLSGSLALFDAYGNTPAEQLVSQVGGPTIGRGLQLAGGLGYAAESLAHPAGERDTKTPQEKAQTGLERAAKTSPQYGMGKALWQLLSEGQATMRINSKDEPMTRLESVMRALGFTPARQSGFYEQRDYLKMVGGGSADLSRQPKPLIERAINPEGKP